MGCWEEAGWEAVKLEAMPVAPSPGKR